MDYYLNLAREQYARFLKFAEERQAENPFHIRTQFFSQRHEANISKSIIEGISEADKYNEKHPVKP